MTRDHNLLFGVFAVQLGKVTPVQLMDVASSWASDTSRDLPSRLVELKILSKSDRDLLERLVNEAVSAHGGDVEKTLASFGGEEQVHRTYRGSIVLTADGQVSIPSRRDTPVAGRIDTGGPDEIGSIKGVFETPGRYTELHEYGRGGMGRVLLVHDDFLGRDIALKELLPHLGEAEHRTTLDKNADPGDMHPSPVRFSAHILSRFLQEARITGQLEHPSIVPVYELGHRRDGSLYYTMKLVRGRSLCKALSECNNLVERLRYLPHFVDLCQAIAYAHSRKIIHRDIKPANVMVGEFGETVVLDWGLAKKRDREDVHEQQIAETILAMNLGDDVAAAKTAYGQILGTPVYMAPEQAEGDLAQVDEQSDVYALGVVLYEILTGKVPFEGKSTREILNKVIAGELIPVATFEEHAPPELIAIATKATRKDKAARYSDVKSLADEVQRFQSGALVRAYTYKRTDLLTRFVHRYRPIVLTVAAAMILMVFVTGIYAIRITQTQKALIAQTERADRARIAAEAEHRRAESEAAAANQFTELLLALLELSHERDPGSDETPEVRMRERIAELMGDLNQDPLIQARVMEAAGKMTAFFGHQYDAAELFESALKIRREHQDPSAPELTRVFEDLGQVYLGAGRYPQAMTMFTEALQQYENIGSPDTSRLGGIYEGIGDVQQGQGQLDAAQASYTKALELLGYPNADPSASVAKVLHSTGHLNESKHDYVMALKMYQADIDIKMAIFGKEHPATQHSQECLDRAAQKAKASDGESDVAGEPADLDATSTIDPKELEDMELAQRASRFFLEGNYNRAIPLFEEKLRRVRQQAPEDAALISNALYDLGSALARTDQPARGIESLQEALELSISVRGDSHATTTKFRNELERVKSRQ